MDNLFKLVNIGLLVMGRSKPYEVYCSTIVEASKTLSCFNGTAFVCLPFEQAVEVKLKDYFNRKFFNQFPFKIIISVQALTEPSYSYTVRPNLQDIENVLLSDLINILLNE